MPARFFRRCLAAAVALVAAASSPALAFAHGYAHAELREHAVEPHHEVVDGLAVGSDQNHHGHGHAVVDASVCSRLVVGLSSVPPVAASPLAAVVIVRAPLGPRAVNESPPQYGAHPPPPTRAPPAPAL